MLCIPSKGNLSIDRNPLWRTMRWYDMLLFW